MQLLSTVSLFGKQLTNRVAMAPLTRGRCDESRAPSALHVDYYTQRAGVGLIVSEGTAISEEGYGWPGSPGIYNDQQINAWKTVTEAVHEQGGAIICQLWHVGRAGHTSFLNGNPMFAPSAVKMQGDGVYTNKGKVDHETPTAMTIDDIKRTVEHYKQAAINAREAGFDGVELHAANGYLPNQFLDSRSNLREDEYGGSVENRARFVLEAVDAICAAWSADRLAVRISPNGVFNDMGHPEYRETFTYLIGELNKRGIACLHMMDGLGFGFHKLGEPMTLAEVRPQFDGVLMGNCGYAIEDAEQQIAQGHADMMAFGRPLITNPDFVERVRNGWPLNPCDDMSKWYMGGAEGYSDYANYAEQPA